MFILMFKAACTDKQWSFPLRIYVVKVNQFTWNWICLHLLKKSLLGNFILCAVWLLGKYLLKVNNEDSSKVQGSCCSLIVDCEHVYWFGRIRKAEDYSTSKIVTVKLRCSRLAIRISERCQWHRSMDLLLPLNKFL